RVSASNAGIVVIVIVGAPGGLDGRLLMSQPLFHVRGRMLPSTCPGSEPPDRPLRWTVSRRVDRGLVDHGMAPGPVGDGEPGGVKALAQLLAEEGHEVVTAADVPYDEQRGQSARGIDAVVLGAGADGSAQIARLRAGDPHLVVVDRPSDARELLPWLEAGL